MGHSMGGKVAMQMALMQPERVRKLIVVDISPGPYPHHHHDELSAIAAIDPSKITERVDAEQIFRSHLDDEGTIQFLMKNLSRQPEGNYAWKANMPVLIDHYDNLMKGIETSETFQGPVLFIKGAKSTSVKDQDLPLIRSLFPQAELISIDDAGHWVHADKPAALIDSVLTFLGTN
jgi:pimeloyl-ACP methyl ester carboxylesterase